MSPWQGILELSGLQSDFYIFEVKQFRKTKKVYFYLKRKQRKGFCSGCGAESCEIHSIDRVQLRDLSVFEYKTYVVVERFTLRCEGCRGYLVEDFWLWRKRKDFTWRYEQKISQMCEEMTNASVGRLEELNDKTVYNIDYELLLIRLQNQKLPKDLGPYYSLDEVHFKSYPNHHTEKDKEFITNLLDLTYKKVISNHPGRGQKSAENCFRWLSKSQRRQASGVAMDQHDPYLKATRLMCPNADIVLDRFHIAKLFNETMDDFRKYQLELAQDNDEIQLLKGKYKWLLLTRESKLSKQNQELLSELKQINERVIEALLIRDHFFDFFESPTLTHAKRQWYKLMKLVKEVDIKQFTEFFRKLKKYMHHIWSYFQSHISSGVIEAINHKIKVTRAAAYGYRNRTYYQLKILQRVGFLNSKFAQLPKIQGLSS